MSLPVTRGKINIIVGPTCSGKSTLKKVFMEAGYEGVISYTTRPPRPGELDGWDYHFCSQEWFERMRQEGVFAESRSYQMADGKTVWYGTAAASYMRSKDVVVVLDPRGARKVKRLYGDRVTIHYLDAPDMVLIKRSRARGDDRNEFVRRVMSDRQDMFKYLGMGYE